MVVLSLQSAVHAWHVSNVRTSRLRPVVKAASCTRNLCVKKTTPRMCSPFAPYFNLRRPFSGLVTDWRRRAPYYQKDWTDGVRPGAKKKTLAAISFLYFACLAPTVAFGGLTSLITNGSMGVIEFIVSCGVGGMVYAVLCGQPLTFLGPTGLTLAFTGALYRFVEGAGLPFLPMYSWIGLWTSFFLAIGAVFNVSYFIRFCTRFTDDCFNSLISLNFLYEAVRSVARSFTQAGTDLGSAFFSMNLALATWASTTGVANFKQSKLVSSSFREGGLQNRESLGPCPPSLSHLLFVS